MVPILVKLFNLILNTGHIPEEWILGIIKPLHKSKGDVNNPDNYRAITLISCFAKCFTSVVNNRLQSFIDEVGVVGPEQVGFKKGCSTIDHIFVLNALIELYLFKKKRIYAGFVDYKKAFDSIRRVDLWRKLLKCSVNGKMFNVIFNLYKHAKSCVSKDGKLSNYCSCSVGVRQGENLSPLLFAIFLHDLEDSLSLEFDGLSSLSEMTNRFIDNDDPLSYLRLYVLLYADDTILLAESETELQRCLDALYSYCDTWGLQINTSKTKIVVFFIEGKFAESQYSK